MNKMMKLCEECEEQPGTVLCSECCRSYCDGCNKFNHAKPAKKRHKLEAIPEGVRVDCRCPLRKDTPLGMLCVDEVRLCCPVCKIKKLHKDHNVVDLSEVAQDN